MNAFRMFLFAVALLMTAFLLRVLAYAATSPQPFRAAPAAQIVTPGSAKN